MLIRLAHCAEDAYWDVYITADNRTESLMELHTLKTERYARRFAEKLSKETGLKIAPRVLKSGC